ncbi:PREDICTED: thioredoxin, mitochondrial-like isoform X1 [Acropora digitifera]|uniref:thioredoxin, mitochondrial-like isoform X1 n=2 Tax=Acropora digitifera TaxID=70779 RepID=UPI00077ABF4E|nr:PREDICTED: thioredoxin, mitochondrial-like isoform X1 [Acropora digitifera]XP_029212095.1 thioredoxin, mitochondrial-like isoform X1 [Acropora millepora]
MPMRAEGHYQEAIFSKNLMLLRMAHRLTSHHRALFAPMYFSGTSAHITSSSYFRAPFNVKDKDDFEKRVLSSSKPVLVDFHAEWCAPCKALTPKLDSVIGENDGQLELAKVDIDTNSELALEYKVRVTGVPTVLGVKNGKIIDAFTGLVETEQLRRFVEKLLK